MSGLLVKSTVVMRENLAEMTREGLDIPVLLAGRPHPQICRRGLRDSYGAGRVAYARMPSTAST